MIRVVCDTNIFISALLFPRSKPDRILQLARADRIKLFVSDDILNEVARVLREKFRLSEPKTAAHINMICSFSKVIQPSRTISLIAAVDADNRILECAAEARAQFLITGDRKHILPLKKIGKTKITSAAEFLKEYSTALE